MFTKLKVALIRRLAHKRLGRDIAPLQTLATHPEILIPYTRFGQALNESSQVEARLKILGQIRAAKMVECPF